MKLPARFRRTLIALTTGALVFMVGAGIAQAAADRHVVKGNTNHTVYKVGQDITISGKVDGDVYCLGQIVTIDAEVTGDVICAGRTVDVHGKVSGDVRVAGQVVTVTAKVAGSLALAGAEVTLTDDGSAGRDVSAAADKVDIDGAVGRDVDATGTRVTLNGPIGRDADISSNGTLFLMGSAKVGGDVNYTGPTKKIERSPGAVVAGDVNYRQGEPKKQGGWVSAFRVYGLLAMVFLALALVALFPQLFRRWNKVGSERYGTAVLVGLLAMVGTPFLAIAIMTSLVGIPLAILLLLLWIALLIAAAPFTMYFVGQKLLPKRHPLLAVLAGAILVGLLQLLPVIGFLVSLLALWFGSGVILLNLKRLYKKPNYAAK